MSKQSNNIFLIYILTVLAGCGVSEEYVDIRVQEDESSQATGEDFDIDQNSMDASVPESSPVRKDTQGGIIFFTPFVESESATRVRVKLIPLQCEKDQECIDKEWGFSYEPFQEIYLPNISPGDYVLRSEIIEDSQTHVEATLELKIVAGETRLRIFDWWQQDDEKL